MNTCKRNAAALVATILVFVMLLTPVVGIIGTIPASANHTTPLPEGVTPYGGTPADEFAGGTGEENDPFQISTAEEFVYFRKSFASQATSSMYFVLTADIALNAPDVKSPVNFNGTPPTFEGHLDGAGFTIYNMYSSNGYSATALFGTLSGTVKNLTFDGVTASCINTNAAVVALYSSSTIENVHVKNATVSVSGGYAAGVVAIPQDNSIFRNCSVSGTIKGTSGAGGIAAIYNFEAKTGPITFDNCVNDATITSTGNCAGGILGVASANGCVSGVKYLNCTNNGAITSKAYAGGIVGQHYRVRDFADFDYCTNNGAIATTGGTGAFAGGIIGYEYSGGPPISAITNIRNCKNTGAITTAGTAGGFVGQHKLTKIELNIVDSANYGNVDGGSVSGGIVGNVTNEWGNACSLRITNCANYGNVGALGGTAVAGGVAGYYNFVEATIVLDGFISTGNVTGTATAGGIVGKYSNGASSTMSIKANDTWLRGTVTVTNADGNIAVFVAQPSTTADPDPAKADKVPNLIAKDSGFDLAFSAGGVAVEATAVASGNAGNGTSVVGYNDGTAAVTDAAYPVADPTTFAASALTSLNTASNGEYNTWVAHDTYVAVFKVIPLVVTNEAALNHGYDRSQVEVAYTINDVDNIKTVDVTYYNRTDLTAPLADSPVLPGDYRVVLQGKDAQDAAYGDAVMIDYTIDKGVVHFQLTNDMTGIKQETDYQRGHRSLLSAAFKGASFEFLAKLYGYENQVVGELLAENLAPSFIYKNSINDNNITDQMFKVGTYYFTYVFEGNDLYKPLTYKWEMKITKGIINYPAPDAEGRWTVPTVYTGLEQFVVFNSVNGDADAFDITYSEPRSGIDACDEITTTVTLSLKEEYAEDCDVAEGDPPVYQVTWKIEKAITTLVLYGPDGNPVENPTEIVREYDGESYEYYVNVLNEKGETIAERVAVFTVSSVATTTETVTYQIDTALDPNHKDPTPLDIVIEVTPKNYEIVIGTIADKPYDGTSITVDESLFTITDAPVGATWEAYTYQWKKWNAETETWDEVDEAVNAGKYILEVKTTMTVATPGATPDGMASGTSAEITIERIKPTLVVKDIEWTDVRKEGNDYFVPCNGTDMEVEAYVDDEKFIGTILITYTKGEDTPQTAAPSRVGTYVVDISFEGDENYLPADRITFTVTIEKRKVMIPTGDELWNYTEPFTYEAGVTYTVDVVPAVADMKNAYIGYTFTNNKQSNQGTYTATITIWVLNNEDYVLTDLAGTVLDTVQNGERLEYTATRSWTINKATPNMEGIDFEAPDEDLVYNGSSQMVNATFTQSYLKADYTILRDGEEVSKVVDAGNYEITVTFSLKDTVNYNPIPAGKESKTIEFTIAKMTIDPGLLSFTGTEATYDGQLHGVELEDMDGLLDIAIKYSQNGVEIAGTKPDAAGDYDVEASLTVNEAYSNNYELAYDVVTTTMTIAKATYSESAYAIDGKLFDVIFGDEIAQGGVTAEEWEVIINAAIKALCDRHVPVGNDPNGNVITVADISVLPSMDQPGDRKTVEITFRGSDNYEEITATAEITLLLRAITIIPSTDHTDVTVTFPEGAPEDTNVTLDTPEPTEEMKGALEANTDITFNADFYGVWAFTATDVDGKELDDDCEWTVQIVLDKHAKKAFEKETYHLSRVTQNKKGEVKLTNFKNYEYDAETGILTLKLSSAEDLNATYALAIPKDNTGLIVGISAGVVLLAVIIAGVVVLVVIKRKKRAAMFAEYENVEEPTADETDEYATYTSDDSFEYVGTEEAVDAGEYIVTEEAVDAGEYVDDVDEYAPADAAEDAVDVTDDTPADGGDDTNA